MLRLCFIAVALLGCVAACEDHRARSADEAIQILSGVDPEGVLLGDFVGDQNWWLGDAVLYSTSHGSNKWSRDVWVRRLDRPAPDPIAAAVGGCWPVPHALGATAIGTQELRPNDLGVYPLTLHPLDGRPALLFERAKGLWVFDLDRCEALITGEGGRGELWRGRCDSMHQIAPELDVHTATPGLEGRSYAAARSVAGGDYSLYEVGPDDAVARMPAASLGATAPPGPVELRCWASGCVLFHHRASLKGADVEQAYDFVGRTLYGAPVLELGMLRTPTSGPRTLAWIVASSDFFAEDQTYSIHSRNLEDGTTLDCPIASYFPPWVLWRRDGRGYVIIPALASGSAGSRPAVVGTLGVGCVAIDDASWISFAPDSASLAWLSSRGELWLARADGSDPRHLLPELTFAGWEGAFVSPRELLLRSPAVDGDLLWLVRLTGSAAEVTPLAAQVFGRVLPAGDRQVLVGTAHNSQDGTGELTLVDLDTLGHRALDGAVSSYVVEGGMVAYWHRGRYASASDGLWVKRIP